VSSFCCLIVNNDNLDFAEIEKNIKLKPTDIYHKGEVKDSKYDKSEHSEDGWVYEVSFEDDKLGTTLDSFISDLLMFKEYIRQMSNKYHVRLWFDIYSDYAQINIALSPSVVQKISELGIGIDIQVYSHGDLE